eukprot:6911991-Ditylum_brightwellii.AAC.1
MCSRHFASVALQRNEGAITSSIEQGNIKTNKELNINCNPDIQPFICMHGQLVALANESATQDGERYLFMDELMVTEFGLDNCCTNHLCYHKRLFKEMREAPYGVGILGIGGVRKPEGIRTVVFHLTDSMGDVHQIELENVLYIPDAPKNLISITPWSEERKDNCGILSQ